MRSSREALPRFVLVGATTAALSALGVFALVDLLGVRPLAAAAMVAVIGNLWGFHANRRWSFLAAQGKLLRQLVRYAMVSFVAVLASVCLFGLLTELGGVHYILASLAVSALFAVTNFIAHFHWSFAPGKTTRPTT